jgi:hypothetical protein
MSLSPFQDLDTASVNAGFRFVQTDVNEKEGCILRKNLLGFLQRLGYVYVTDVHERPLEGMQILYDVVHDQDSRSRHYFVSCDDSG